jgi:hypothetical protein
MVLCLSPEELFVKTLVCYTGLVTCLLLAGCAKPDPEPEGVIPQHQLDALNKAQATEQVLLDAEQRRREEMERKGI